MIRYPRRRVDEQGRPVEPDGAWFASAAARTSVAKQQKANHKADAGVYHHDQVHAALEKLFHLKCVYCESKPAASADWDVEHFRPKSHYYWLTYEWTNLYLSCAHCNQARRDRPMWDDPAWGPSAGKLDQFPLSGSYRAIKHGDSLSKEGRLLLDPCADQPDRHLTFDATGSAVALAGSRKAKPSIEVFNLNRKRLRDRRRELAEAHLVTIRAYLGSHPLATILHNLVNAHGTDASEHAGVARAIARDPVAFGL